MDSERQKKAERFISYMKNEIEGDNLQGFIPDAKREESIWFGNNSVLTEAKGELHSFLGPQSPLLTKKGWPHDNLTIRSEPQEILTTLYEGKGSQFTLAKLFGEQASEPFKNEMEAHEEEGSFSEGNENDGSEPEKKKFNKGLKLLSVIVQDIVIKKQSTTYKEVANLILNETVNKGNFNFVSKSDLAKEEQNIKRRVYDALNVLISAGILIKEGKKVRKNDINKKIKLSARQVEIKTLRSLIGQKRLALEQKVMRIERMHQELDAIRRLIARNKIHPSPKYISFPFIIIKPSSLAGTQLKIRKQADDCKIALSSNKEFEVFGDLEIVSMINPRHGPN